MSKKAGIMNITFELPEKVIEKLKERALSEDSPLDEVILNLIVNQVSADPETKSEAHLNLCEKYLCEGEELIAKEDYVQASEKFWGAAAQALKTVAAKRGEELRSHAELHRYAFKLREETGDPDLSGMWRSATALHQNFYEAWWPPELVKEAVMDVKGLVKKLKRL